MKRVLFISSNGEQFQEAKKILGESVVCHQEPSRGRGKAIIIKRNVDILVLCSGACPSGTLSFLAEIFVELVLLGREMIPVILLTKEDFISPIPEEYNVQIDLSPRIPAKRITDEILEVLEDAGNDNANGDEPSKSAGS